MKDLIRFLVFAFSIISVSCLIGNSYAEYQCDQYEKITGVETHWSTMDNCYVSTEHGWQHWDEYKLRIVIKDSTGG